MNYETRLVYNSDELNNIFNAIKVFKLNEKGEISYFELANYLKQALAMELDYTNGVARDLLISALTEVDYTRIAREFIANRV